MSSQSAIKMTLWSEFRYLDFSTKNPVIGITDDDCGLIALAAYIGAVSH